MQADSLVIYIASLLNIKTENPFIVDDIFEELEQISDLEAFKCYLKSKTTKEEYKYSNGFTKFLSIASKYKKKQKQQIVLDNPKINSFSEELYIKTCDVFEEINWMIQNGNDIESDEVKKFIYVKFYNSPKQIKVLKIIGDKKELLRLVKHSKSSLEEKIKQVVIGLMIKKDSNTQIDYNDKSVIKRLEGKKRINK